jgi:hypothetical protein
VTEPGWYNDELDADLARWHDGSGWTSHTLVKADWRGPGAPPPPLQPAFAPAPEPTMWMPSAHAAPSPYELDDVVMSRTGMVDRYRTMPMWARVAGPAVAAAIVLGAVSSNDGGNTDDPSGPVATIVVPMDEAIEIAQSQIDTTVSDLAIRRLIEAMCSTDVEASAASARSITREPAALSQLIEAAGDGALAHCEDDLQGRPSFLNDVYAAAVVDDVDATSSTTAVATEATVASTPTTRPPTVTTKPPTATTKAPPRPTPATPPPTQAPATTAAPPPTQSQCHPSYSGCLKANSPDYDCEGGQGNGPDYTGPVTVYGPDTFDLDRDNDGIGCEDS